MTFDPAALRLISYGLYVVTSRKGERINGQLANAVMQVTSQPCRLAIAISKLNLTHEYIVASSAFVVTVLSEEAPLAFLGTFGFKSGRDIDKFAGVNYRRGGNGCPLVTDYALAYFEASVETAGDYGSHTVFVGVVDTGEVLRAGRPMTYAYYHGVKKGKTAANAPTFNAAVPSTSTTRSPSTMTKYVCSVCGYVYDPAVGDPENGVAPGTAFENLPADWVCPVCGATKDQFEPEK